MALDQLQVSFNLKEIHCTDEADGLGTAEPFMWVVYFKIDGDGVFVGSDLKLHGNATVVSTPGSHGNLPSGVDAGMTIGIPSALGNFKTTLKPIRTPLKDKTIGGVVGLIAILLEEDSTSDADIEVGHAALNAAVQKGLDDIIKTLGITKTSVSDDEISALESTISSKVEAAIKNEVDLFQGLWSYIGFGNGQDDKIGTAKFIAKHADLEKNNIGSTSPLNWNWNTASDGIWSMKGSVTVHRTSAVAVMRSGDWATTFLFGRTTDQFAQQNQVLFDKNKLRLLQMETWIDGGGIRRWSSIHRSGDWTHALRLDRDTKTFLSETQALFDKNGLRLENMATYVNGGVRHWAGSYRSGDWAHRLTIDRDGSTFAKETQELFDKQGLRLEQLVTYVDGNTRKWAGIYRSGDWGHRFTMDRDTKTFLQETQTWFDQGFRLIDVERYDASGQARWAAVYRTGNWTQRHIVDRGIESLIQEQQDAFDKDALRLTCVNVYGL